MQRSDLTLGQLATAVGATPRWVLNALTRLGVPRRYAEPLARRLALARTLAEHAGTPLSDAWVLAGRALKEADPHRTWRHESPNGAVVLSVDMPRFLTSYGARLALALNHYGERRRGRRPRRRGTAVERARAWGIDTTLLTSALSRTPELRLRMLHENMEALRSLRENLRRREPGRPA